MKSTAMTGHMTENVNCVSRGTVKSLRDLLYNATNPLTEFTRNGSRRSGFAHDSTLLPSDVIDFAMLQTQILLVRKFFC